MDSHWMDYTNNLCNKRVYHNAQVFLLTAHMPPFWGSGWEYEIPFPQVGYGTYLEGTWSETLHYWGLSTSLANKSLECERQLRTGFNLIHDQPSSKLTWQWKITIFHRGDTLPETNIALRIDGWKTSFLLGSPIFRGYVSFREGTSSNWLFCPLSC